MDKQLHPQFAMDIFIHSSPNFNGGLTNANIIIYIYIGMW